eukprot:1552198-Pyramimonas_sp.AAC.1
MEWLVPPVSWDTIYAWTSIGAGDPALLEAGRPAIGSMSAVSTMSAGAPSHGGPAATVKAVDPSASEEPVH